MTNPAPLATTTNIPSVFPTSTTTASASTSLSTTTQPTSTKTYATGIQVGNRAADFQFIDLEEKQIRLWELGRPVLLNFWATWCGPCKREIPFLEEIYTGWTDTGLVIYTVNMGEDPDTVKAFMTENKMALPVIFDPNKQISRLYGITAIPTTYFIDADGIIRQKVIGSFPDKETIEGELAKIMP
jgi:thiol-disulfide isomerase/thioredoxin